MTDGAASNGTSPTANSTVNVVIPAKVTSVAATTTGNATDLDANKVVTITVNFDHAVNVTVRLNCNSATVRSRPMRAAAAPPR